MKDRPLKRLRPGERQIQSEEFNRAFDQLEDVARAVTAEGSYETTDLETDKQMVEQWPIWIVLGDGNTDTHGGTVNNSPTGGSGTWTFLPAGLPTPPNVSWIGYTVTFTSGTQNGRTGLVTAWDGTNLTIFNAILGAPANGDTFTIANPSVLGGPYAWTQVLRAQPGPMTPLSGSQRSALSGTVQEGSFLAGPQGSDVTYAPAFERNGNPAPIGTIALAWWDQTFGGLVFDWEGASIGPVTNNTVSKGKGTNNVQDSTATDDGTTFSFTKDLALPTNSVTLKSGAITNATNATPIVITSAAHGLTNHECVTIEGVGGNTAANGFWRATVIDANTFSLDTSVGNFAYTSGGTFYESTLILPNAIEVDLANAYQILEVITPQSIWNAPTAGQWNFNGLNGEIRILRISSVLTGQSGTDGNLTFATFWPNSIAGITLPALINLITTQSFPVVVPSGGMCQLYNPGSNNWLLWGQRQASSALGVNRVYTGTTTNAFVTVYDQGGGYVYSAKQLDQLGATLGITAIHGGTVIKNTGGSNALQYQVITSDVYGTSVTYGPRTLNPGASEYFSFDKDNDARVVQISVAPTGIPAVNVAANSTQNTALTAITGLLANDEIIHIRKNATQNGLFILPADLNHGGTTADGQATVKYVNVTAAGITPTAGETYRFVVLRTTAGGVQLAGTPPYQEVKLQVQDAVGGSHTTYDARLAIMG